jgi:hypothetical protein
MSTQTAAPDLRYPVGQFIKPAQYTDAFRRAAIATIAEMPAKMRAAIGGLNAQQLETPYRPGGWTVRQVVHHVADSHMNAFVRLKFALTQDTPTIMAYDEARWATTPEYAIAPEAALQLIDGLHQRWTALWRGMSPAEFARKLNHPERGAMSLDDLLALYDWHSRHHVAHVTALRARQGW